MAATLVLSGCSKDETINQSSGELIQFKMLAAGTRAAEKQLSDIQTTGFDVFAFMIAVVVHIRLRIWEGPLLAILHRTGFILL